MSDFEARIRATIDRRQEKVDAWWKQEAAKLVKKHKVESLWDVPKKERDALRSEFAERSREAHGIGRIWGDPDSERMKALKEEADVADLPPPRVDRPNDPKADIPCIEDGCGQKAVTEAGMRKHIAHRHPNRTEAEIVTHFSKAV